MADPTPEERILFIRSVRQHAGYHGMNFGQFDDDQIWHAVIELSKRIHGFAHQIAAATGTGVDPQSYRMTPPEVVQIFSDEHAITEGLLVGR